MDDLTKDEITCALSAICAVIDTGVKDPGLASVAIKMARELDYRKDVERERADDR